MGREVWGTYSVRDHLAPQAWTADVFVYDKLVIPVPPGDDHIEGSAEWKRWHRMGWKPERQQELLSILHDRAYPFAWSSELQEQWKDLRAPAIAGVRVDPEGRSAFLTDPWMASGQVLISRLPSHVTAVNAVATYRSVEELKQAVKLHYVEERAPLPAGQAVVVLGREYLVPDPEEFNGDDDALLREAVELSNDSDYKSRRKAYWRWQQDFLGGGRLIDSTSMQAAVEEMKDLIADEQRELNSRKIRFITLFALNVATAGVGLAAGPLAPVAVAGAFLSVGNFVAGEVLQRKGAQGDLSPAALFISGRKDLSLGPFATQLLER